MIPQADFPSRPTERVLLGQLNSLGDCLLATTIARQIKHDFPGCHLTWAIGSMCRPIIESNPDVDEVWEIPLAKIEDVPIAWEKLVRDAGEGLRTGRFSHLFMTQISPANLHNYDGNIRGSLFRAYPRKITVPIAPVIRLTPQEVERVGQFVLSRELSKFRHVVLFECAPTSGQSELTPQLALGLALNLVTRFDNVAFILSSSQKIDSVHERVFDASGLTFRENAELVKHCSLLIGCSSGISWLSTSDWAGGIPMVQVLKSDAAWSNSLALDFDTWNLPADGLIELADCSMAQLEKIMAGIFEQGFGQVRDEYSQAPTANFQIFSIALADQLRKRQYKAARRTVSINCRRRDFNLTGFLKAIAKSFLRLAKSKPMDRE